MANIKFSPLALTDMQEIKTYIAEDLCDEAAAVGVISKIMARIRSLEDFPRMGAPLSSILDMETGYRFLVCGSYMAFYRCEGDDVWVVRVLYGRRNYMQILFGESADGE